MMLNYFSFPSVKKKTFIIFFRGILYIQFADPNFVYCFSFLFLYIMTFLVSFLTQFKSLLHRFFFSHAQKIDPNNLCSR